MPPRAGVFWLHGWWGIGNRTETCACMCAQWLGAGGLRQEHAGIRALLPAGQEVSHPLSFQKPHSESVITQTLEPIGFWVPASCKKTQVICDVFPPPSWRVCGVLSVRRVCLCVRAVVVRGERRHGVHPSTPDATVRMSNRRFNGLVRAQAPSPTASAVGKSTPCRRGVLEPCLS